MFWPGMAAQITDTVLSCPNCSTHQRCNTKEPLTLHPAPSRPWERIAADLCEVNGRHYLVMVDYYSNFIEVDNLTETTSQKIIECCKCQFARHGIPDVFISDNGPQFSSTLFHQFSEKYQFEHRTSSLHYQQSNGKAEKAVQTSGVATQGHAGVRAPATGGRAPALEAVPHRCTADSSVVDRESSAKRS